MKKDIFAVQSLDELKECGKLVEVREAYKRKADPMGFKGRTNSWAAMYESIKALKAAIEDDDPYFKSKAAKVIFYLLEMSGEARTDFLGIEENLYKDSAAARKWRDGLIKLVHPDNCNHPNAPEAVKEITRIYGRMTKA